MVDLIRKTSLNPKREESPDISQPIFSKTSLIMAFNGEIFEIFSWLPAKALYKFKAVCKSCCEYPTETLFTRKQAQQHLQSKEDSGFLVQPNASWISTPNVEFLCMNGEKSSLGFPKRSLQFLKSRARVLASSNGLIVCKSYKIGEINKLRAALEIFVCNPVTQTWLPIPSPAIFEHPSPIGVEISFDDNRDQVKYPDDYKLIVVKPGTEMEGSLTLYFCSVYYPVERRWKEMKMTGTGDRNLRYEMPVYCNGLLYIISDVLPDQTPYVVSYNIEQGLSTILQLPKDSGKDLHRRSDDFRIFKFGNKGSSFQSICLIRLWWRSVFTIWVLEDASTSSWSRILKKRVKDMGVKKHNRSATAFTVVWDSLVFIAGHKAYRYRLRDSNSSEAQEICGVEECTTTNLRLYPYANTLRPCGSAATLPI